MSIIDRMRGKSAAEPSPEQKEIQKRRKAFDAQVKPLVQELVTEAFDHAPHDGNPSAVVNHLLDLAAMQTELDPSKATREYLLNLMGVNEQGLGVHHPQTPASPDPAFLRGKGINEATQG